MPNSEKDRLAAEVEDRWVDFQDGLSNKRRYPVEQFRAFWEAGKRYAELTKNDPLIHRSRLRVVKRRYRRVPWRFCNPGHSPVFGGPPLMLIQCKRYKDAVALETVKAFGREARIETAVNVSANPVAALLTGPDQAE